MHKKKNTIKLFSLVLALTIISLNFVQFFPKFSYGEDINKPRVILYIIDRLSAQDLQEPSYKNIQKLVASGSIGIMNANTGSLKTPENTFPSLCSGQRAVGGASAGNVYNAGEIIHGNMAKTILNSLTGVKAKYENVVYPYLRDIVNNNKDNLSNIKFGSLGDALHSANLKTAVIGNSDLSYELPDFSAKDKLNYTGRAFAQSLMDSKGLVDYGDVSESLLKKDSKMPGGLAADTKKIFEKFNFLYKSADVLAVCPGDTERLESIKPYISEFRYNLNKKKIMLRADSLLGKIMKVMKPSDTLMLISPTPQKLKMNLGEQMTPLVVWGKSFTNGLLTSGTTHRHGIVTNIDVTATILNQLGLKVDPLVFSGQKLQTDSSVMVNTNAMDRINYIADFNTRLVFNTKERLPVLFTFSTYVIICLVLSLLRIYLKNKFKIENNLFNKLIQFLTLSIIIVPIAILLLPLIKPFYFGKDFTVMLAQSYFYIALMTFVITLILRLLLKNTFDGFIVAGFGATAVLLIDLFTGSNLLQNSPLGYDPQGAARFFGLGNEVMGILLGSSIIATTMLIDRLPKKRKIIKIASILLYAFIVFVLTVPGLGTKAGGAITAVASFGVVVLKLYDKKVGFKQIIYICAGIGSLLLLLIAVDLLHKGGAQSHIGRAAMLINQGGAVQALDIIQRKLAMNYKLIRVSYWSYVLIVSLIVLGLMFKWKLKVITDMFKKYPYAKIGCIGTVVSSLVGLVFNDAGIVACATNSIYPMMLLIFMELKTDFDTMERV